MSSTPAERTDASRHPADGPLPEFVDWILGIVIALAGSISLVGGSALVFLVDRDAIVGSVEEGSTTVVVGTTELTDAEQVEVADAVVSWTGTGLLVTGLGLVVFAVGYVVVRHRAHGRARAGERVGSYGSFAVLGAVVTSLLSFLPVSPALGGALAGYLERSESDRTASVGALAGFLPMVPLLSILVFVLGGLVAGLLAVEQGGTAVVLGVATFLVSMLVAAVGAGLGALGGYVGGTLAERRTVS